jgi:hypothetical protein
MKGGAGGGGDIHYHHHHQQQQQGGQLLALLGASLVACTASDTVARGEGEGRGAVGVGVAQRGSKRAAAARKCTTLNTRWLQR